MARLFMLFFLFVYAEICAQNQEGEAEACSKSNPLIKHPISQQHLGKSRGSETISLDFKKIPVRELLQFIAESMGCNIIMSESVSGNLALHFQKVSWQQAFNIVLEMTGMVQRRMGNVLLIASPAEFAARQKNMAQATSIQTVKVKLYHANVAQVLSSLKNESTILSPGALVSANVEDNSLWIREDTSNLPVVISFLRQKDQIEKQILICAKVVNLDDKKVNELGIRLKSSAKLKSDGGLTLNFPEVAQSSLNFAIASIAEQQLLSLELAALETSGHSKIIADPKILTLNHQAAIIEAGEEIPYQEKTASGATNVSFKKAALSLKVTPSVLPDGRITLELEISQNKVSSLAVNGTPGIQTQELKTQVTVKNHQTVILGGIFEASQGQLSDKVPLFSRIPLIGALLSHTKKEGGRKQLLVFVTPQIVSDDLKLGD